MKGRPDVETVAPLSFQQEEMVGKLRRHPECAQHYDYVLLLRLDGDVDVERLAGALHDLSARHAALRTSLGRRHGKDVQRVHRVGFGSDLVVHDDANPDDLGHALVAACYGNEQVFGGELLFRPRIHLVGSLVYLSLTVHHLVYDEWSLGLVRRDLAELYAARLACRAPRLPEPSLTYTAFARRQRRQWPVRAQAAMPFWCHALDGCRGDIDWPRSTVDSASQKYQQAVLRFELPADCLDTVRRLSQSERASPFMVLLGATAVGIASVTGENDLLLGTDTNNRADPEVADLIGMLINTQLTRIRVDQARRFVELLRTVREFWLDAADHRDAHVEPVLRALGLPYPLLVEMTSWRDAIRVDLRLPGAIGVPVPVPTADQYWRDLFVNWFHEPDRYWANVHYRPARVQADAVNEMAARTIGTLKNPWAAL